MKHRYHVAYHYTGRTATRLMGFGSTEFTYDDEPDVTSRLVGLMRQGIEETLKRDHSAPVDGFSVVIINVMPLVIEEGEAEKENPFGL